MDPVRIPVYLFILMFVLTSCSVVASSKDNYELKFYNVAGVGEEEEE